jgi:transposase
MSVDVLTFRNTALAEAYDAGGDVGEIANAFGLSIQAVRNIVSAHGIRLREGGRDPHGVPGRDEMIASEYLKGFTIEQVAVRMGLGGETVRKSLVLNGIPRRPAHVPSNPEREAAMVALYVSGYSLHSVAEQFDTSSTAVNRALTKAGVERRANGRPRDKGQS